MKIKQINLEGVRIVDFEPKFAASVADMWNASPEGWNGELWNMTEQQVLIEEGSSNYIGLYLVIDAQDKVLGYCKLEEYSDQKAVYIALLNVIPQYWGRKYGKVLILKTLQNTIDSGYSRLDLHSWSGNTRAVPLYKKTGFRWQTSNSSTYMMNFLPYLLNLELLQPFFAEVDWYENCERDLSLEPDGNMERGFEFFHYNWKKNEMFLEAGFNADAKGLSYLNCNDFELKLDAPQLKTCFGSREVFLEMTNKGSEPLMVEINMSGEAEITISEKRNLSLQGNAKETFKIMVRDDIELGSEEIPSVTASLLLNGLPLQMKLGLKPQAPVAVVLKHDTREVYQQGVIELFLQFKNNLKEAVKVNLALPDVEELSFQENEISESLQADEIKTIKMAAVLTKGCFYDRKVKVHLQCNGETISYIQKIKREIADLETIIHGETEEYWSLRKGSLQLKYARKTNMHPLYLDVDEKTYWFYMMPPKLSEPFDKEFTNQAPENASFNIADDGVVMRVQYKSKNQKIMLGSIFKMRFDNVIEHDWEIENTSEENMKVKHLETNFDAAATQAIYDGKLLGMTVQQKNMTWKRLVAEKVTSGWMYFNNAGFSAALSWNQNQQFKFGEWWQRVLYDIGELQPGEKRNIKGESLMLNAFKSWQDFYCWKFGNRNYPADSRVQELVINDNNPFCANEIGLKYIDLNENVEEKEIRLFGDDILLISDKYISGEWQKKVTRHSKFKLEIEEEAKSYAFEKITFGNSIQLMQFNVSEQAGQPVSILQGEKLELQAAADFMTGIFSIKYYGKELLSSSFPKSIIRGWSNHWCGGFQITPHRTATALLIKQKTELQQETRLDNFRNVWQGFSFTVKYDDSIPHLEEISVKYSFLVSPSQDVIAAFYEVMGTGGAYLNRFRASANIFINEDQQVKINCKDATLKVSERYACEDEKKLISAELPGTNCFLNFYSPQNTVDASVFSRMSEISYQYIINGIESGKVKASHPFYLLISDRIMTPEELQVLNKIKWS
ncbi:MAG: GNAT family N-acetyltransferase [Candidatus Cloacimonetes bacterium]|nr:GNAT family N-acetyltransferase [Candidatus Cloacimonadota bacterium]